MDKFSGQCPFNNHNQLVKHDGYATQLVQIISDQLYSNLYWQIGGTP